MSFATVLCLIPEIVLQAPVKITVNGPAAGCQLFYNKIYGYFLQSKMQFLPHSVAYIVPLTVAIHFDEGGRVGEGNLFVPLLR